MNKIIQILRYVLNFNERKFEKIRLRDEYQYKNSILERNKNLAEPYDEKLIREMLEENNCENLKQFDNYYSEFYNIFDVFNRYFDKATKNHIKKASVEELNISNMESLGKYIRNEFINSGDYKDTEIIFNNADNYYNDDLKSKLLLFGYRYFRQGIFDIFYKEENENIAAEEHCIQETSTYKLQEEKISFDKYLLSKKKRQKYNKNHPELIIQDGDNSISLRTQIKNITAYIANEIANLGFNIFIGTSNVSKSRYLDIELKNDKKITVRISDHPVNPEKRWQINYDIYNYRKRGGAINYYEFLQMFKKKVENNEYIAD